MILHGTIFSIPCYVTLIFYLLNVVFLLTILFDVRFSNWNESDLEELKAAVQIGVDAALGSVDYNNNNNNNGNGVRRSSPRHRHVDISVRK